MKKLIRPGTLVSRRGLASLLDVSKQAVFKIEDRPGFPRPIDVLDDDDRKPVWRRKDVVAYREKRRDGATG